MCRDDLSDARVDLLDGSFVSEGKDPARLARCYLFVFLVDAAIKIVGLALETIFVGALLANVALVTTAGATEGVFERGQQEDSQIGLEVAAGGGMHGEDALAAELTASALVGLGGVGVSVAEDDAARSESRLDDLGDGLSPVGEHQGHLGGRCDGTKGGFGAGVEQDASNAVAEGSSTRLAEGDDAVPGRGKRCGKEPELGGFA